MNEFSCLHGNERYVACDDASTVITSIGFCPQNPSDKTGAAMAVAPVSYSFAPVIASSKHLPHGGCPKRGFYF